MSPQADDRGMRTRQRLWLLVALAAVAAAVVAVLAVASGGDDGPQGLGGGEQLAGAAETNELFDGIPQQGIAVGDPDAPVTLVEFVDLQCPFCAQFARDAVPELVDRYVRPGQVRMELRVLGFLGDDSLEAARVAAAASLQDRAWPFAELFFRNQGRENSGYVTDEFLRSVAASVDGLDADRALEQAEGSEAEDVVARAQRAASTLGVSSTPSFYAGPTGGRLEPVEVTALTADAVAEQLEPLLGDGQ